MRKSTHTKQIIESALHAVKARSSCWSYLCDFIYIFKFTKLCAE